MQKTLAVLVSIAVIMLTGCNESSGHLNRDSVDRDAQYISEYSYYNNGVAYTVGDAQNSTKMFLDFDSMEKAALGAVPNCTHATASCLSKSMGEHYKPVFYNGFI